MSRARRPVFAMPLLLLSIPALVLSACTDKGSGDDTGGGGGTTDGGATEAVATWDCGSSTTAWTGDVGEEFAEACGEGLRGVWVDSDLAPFLWTWPYQLETGTKKGTESAQQWSADMASDLFEDLSLQAPGGTSDARHSTAYLAAAVAAGTVGGASASMDKGCELLSAYAPCGLEDFLTGGTCGAVPLPTPLPPPPAGDDPEGFCADLASQVPTAGANSLNCTVSPLSTVLSFIASQEGAQTEAQWLTVVSTDTSRADRVWWPAWMAAYTSDAPALMLYSLSDGVGGELTGVLAVHEIGLKVSGPKSQVQLWQKYIDSQLKGSGTAPAPDWSRLTFVLPSRLTYRAYPSVDAKAPQDTLRTWTYGQELELADGRTAPFVFTDLVGVIDPCRGEDAASSTACENNGRSWVEVMGQLEAAGLDQVFVADPALLGPADYDTGCAGN